MASPSPSTSYEIGNNYYRFDVFLNHRGEVKKGLATNLYRSLCAHGLSVFLDCEELQAGDNLEPQIEGAIKTASLHIAIFSPRYAESTWCLNELVQMLESRQTILPVFYNVNPSELRWTQGGDGEYARALCFQEKKKNTSDSQPRHNSLTVKKWRDALSVVSYISGFELSACNGDEGLLVQKVVQQVLRKLRKTPLNVAKYATGLHDKVKDFETTMLSQQQSEKITTVGIVGCGGVGKTTLAKELFNLYRSKYVRSCFLSDVRENAAKGFLHGLQSKLLTDLGQPDVHINSTHEGGEMLKIHLSPSRRVLVVIDDVDHMNQLDALFLPIKDAIHSSSFILVTSRDMGLLKKSGIPETFIYKQTGLNQQHSQELFCLHAFNHPYPRTGFEQLVKQFLDVCGGLPLSLQVIGALLCHEDLHYWKAQFNKISKTPPTDILNTLKISYDSLEDEEKQIFLDAACFFIGEDRDTAIRIWDGSDWQGWLGLRNLENKCLLVVDSKNRIRMHDHLRDLGRDIAKKEIPHRLRRSDDIVYDHSPVRIVRGISMVHGTDPAESLKIPANIRGLQLLRAEGNSVYRLFSVPHPPQPVWLHWDSCPYSSLPSWIPVKNLRVLHMQRDGKLETLWQNESQAPLQLRELNIDANISNVPKSIGMLKHLEKFVLHSTESDFKYIDLETLPDEVGGMHSLKLLKLQGCRRLSFLPDSAGNWKNIQGIYLSRCYSLRELPDSAGNWTNLEVIDLSNCANMQGLPDSAGNWTNLREIKLTGCTALQGLPDSAGNWTNLKGIKLNRCTALQGLPDSAGNWTNLEVIDFNCCANMQRLPDSAGNWTNLKEIKLTRCTALQGLPHSARNWTNLTHIYLESCSALHPLPDSAGNWTNLTHIYLESCSALEGLPNSVGNWTNLRTIDLRYSALEELPDSAGKWTNLKEIKLTRCTALQGLPDSAGNWTNLTHINLGSCSALQRLPDSAGNWTNLEVISFTYCANLRRLPDSAGNWTNLKEIRLHGCTALQGLPHSARYWTNVTRIHLDFCSALQRLPDSAGNWTNLEVIYFSHCADLWRLPDSAGNWTNLKEIRLDRCTSLQELPRSAGNWTNLTHINLESCSALQRLPHSVGNWTNLKEIRLNECTALQGLPLSAGNWTNLTRINLESCFALQRLPHSVGNWTNLKEIELKRCIALQGLPHSAGNWTNLEVIYFTGCANLRRLPNSAGNWTKLQNIDLKGCTALQGLPDSAGNWTNLRQLGTGRTSDRSTRST